MKELNQHLAAPIQKEIVAEKRDREEAKYVATIQPQKGQFLWVYNAASDILRQVTSDDYDHVAVLNNGSAKKLIIKPGCVYVVAINKKNAMIKVIKMLRR